MSRQHPSPGTACTWLHVPRGGYGYTIRVPGVVIAATAKRVRIQVERANGAKVARVVRWENLRLQCAHCHGKRKATIYPGGSRLNAYDIYCDRCDEHGEVGVIVPDGGA